MKTIFAISSKYYMNRGEVWTTTSYNNDMWKEYLQNFSGIYVLAPIIEVDQLPKGCKLATMSNVKFVDSSALHKKELSGIARLFRAVKEIVRSVDCGILHSPCFEAELAYRALKKYKKPYIVENRGEQSMHAGFLKAKHLPFPKTIASVFKKMHLNHLEKSYGCIYVSETLRERYYPKNTIQSAVISDLRLPDHFIKEAREWGTSPHVFKIINVGNLSPYKDQATLLRAIKVLKEKGINNIELHLVGKGPLKEELQRQAEQMNIRDNVIFHGFVPWGEELFSLYDKSDLFVLSSLTEGMPRVVLESLARGLPVVSTEVSGSIEVLPEQCIVPVGDYKELANTISKLVNSPDTLTQLSQEGIKMMQSFTETRLLKRKVKFFSEFRELVGGN